MNHTWLAIGKGDVIIIAPHKECYRDEWSSWFGYIPASELIEDLSTPIDQQQIRVLDKLNRDELVGYALLVLDEPFRKPKDSTRVRMNVLLDGRIIQLISMKGNVKDWIKLG